MLSRAAQAPRGCSRLYPVCRDFNIGLRNVVPSLPSSAAAAAGGILQQRRRLATTASAELSSNADDSNGSDLEEASATDGDEDGASEDLEEIYSEEKGEVAEDGPSLWELVQLEPGNPDDWEDIEHDPDSQDPERMRRKLWAPPRPHLWFSTHPEALVEELRQVFPGARHREWHGMVHSVGEGLRAPWEWFEQPQVPSQQQSKDPSSLSNAKPPPGGLREQLQVSAASNPWTPLLHRPPVVAFAQQYLPWCVRLPALWPSRAALKQLAELLEVSLSDHVAAGGRWMLHVVAPSGPVFPAKAGREATLRTDGKRKRYDRNPRAQFVRQLLATLRQREAEATAAGVSSTPTDFAGASSGADGVSDASATTAIPTLAASNGTTSQVHAQAIASIPLANPAASTATASSGMSTCSNHLLSLTRVPCVMETRYWRRLKAREQAPVRALETAREQRLYLSGGVADEGRAARHGRQLVRLGFGGSASGVQPNDRRTELDAKRSEAAGRVVRKRLDHSHAPPMAPSLDDDDELSSRNGPRTLTRSFIDSAGEPPQDNKMDSSSAMNNSSSDTNNSSSSCSSSSPSPSSPPSSPSTTTASNASTTLSTPPFEHPLPGVAVVQLLFNEHLPQHTRRAAIRQARKTHLKQAKRLKVRTGAGTAQLPGLASHRQAVFASIVLPHQAQALERTGLTPVASAGRVNVPELRWAPSSAHTKLLEAEIRLGQRIRPGQLVADLGWNPGGWSYVALVRRARVLAVDVSRHQAKARERLVKTVGEELRSLANAGVGGKTSWRKLKEQEEKQQPQQQPQVCTTSPSSSSTSSFPVSSKHIPPTHLQLLQPPVVQFLEADATRWMLGQPEEEAQPPVNPNQRRGSSSSRKDKKSDSTPAGSTGVLTEQADPEDPHTPHVVNDLNPVPHGKQGGGDSVCHPHRHRMVDWLCCDMIVSPETSLRLLREWLRRRAARRFVVTLKFVGPGGAGVKRTAVEEAERACERFRDAFVPGSPEWPETQKLMGISSEAAEAFGSSGSLGSDLAGSQQEPRLGRLRYWVRKLDSNGNEVTIAGTYVVEEENELDFQSYLDQPHHRHHHHYHTASFVGPLEEGQFEDGVQDESETDNEAASRM